MAPKKQTPTKAAAAKKAREIESPGLGRITRSSPQKAAATTTKQAASPAKRAASPAKKAASPTKTAVSPAKKTAKKAASPSKKAATSEATATRKTPARSTSPAKVQDSTMQRPVGKAASRSATPVEVKSKPSKVTKTKKSKAAANSKQDVLKKRGLLVEDDDDDDSTQTTEELLALFDKRKFTKWDKFMTGLLSSSDAGKVVDPEDVLTPFQEEERLAQRDQPLDCYAKIYWRFKHRFESHIDAYAEDDGTVAYPSIEQPETKKKCPNKSAASKRSPSKSPAKSPAHDRHLPAAPLRDHSKSPAKQAPPALTIPKSGKPTKTSKAVQKCLDEYKSMIRAKDSYAIFMAAYEAEAFEATMLGDDNPPIPPEGLAIEEDHWHLAYTHGVWRAEQPQPSRTISRTRNSSPPPLEIDSATTKMLEAQRMKQFPPPSVFDPPDSVRFGIPGQMYGPATKSPSAAAKKLAAKKKLATARTPSASPGKRLSPGKQQSPVRTPTAPLKTAAPKPKSPVKPAAAARPPTPAMDPHRGPVISTTNPPFIPGTNKPNPFFEPMPAPEVWHRRMPAFFSFGETPYMGQVMSDQINEDLARNHDEIVNDPAPPPANPSGGGILNRISSVLLGRSASSAPEDVATRDRHGHRHSHGHGRVADDQVREIKPLRPTTWELPEVKEEDIQRAMGMWKSQVDEVAGPAVKRKASGQVGGGKRAAR